MTSISIAYNKIGLAIAADSAGSLENGKVFSANKIYRLSKTEPVGMATYGLAEIGNVPIELIAKLYRKSEGESTYPKLSNYRDNFLNFIENKVEIKRSESDVIRYTISRILKYVNNWQIRNQNDEEVNSASSEEEKLIIQTEKTYKALKSNTEKPERLLSNEHLKEVMGEYEKLTTDDFKKNRVPFILKDAFREFIKYCLEYRIRNETSGLLFFGYGQEEIFPEMFEVKFYFKYNNTLYKFDGASNYNKHSGDYEYFGIKPFADSECTQAIINGLSTSIKNLLSENLTDEELIDNISKEMNKHYSGIVGNIGNFSLDELGNVVETLVNLESFNKRVSSIKESVGGPTDVAIISKCDGFVWVERKHYFEKKYNQHFIQNYDKC